MSDEEKGDLKPILIPRTHTLNRTTTARVQLPAEGGDRRVPIEFRTLSIQVYDSQRFVNTLSNKEKQSDSDFFSSLDVHQLPADQVCHRFNVSPSAGLDSGAAEKRLKRNGPNRLARKKSDMWKRVLRYLFGDFCSILWIGVVIFFISWKPLGNPPAPYNLALAIVVILVILMQATFSALQDFSAKRVMDSIMTLIPENASVLRDGVQTTVPSDQLVVGDVVQLSMGQKVPADMRIIKASSDLKFDRAILTGESEEVAGCVDTDEPNFLESRNIALLGTYVCNGTATAVVVLTGPRTVMGRINAATNSTKDERTTLQLEISRFVKIIICLTVSLVVIMLITWVAWLRVDHYDFINTVGILTNLMSLVVAFIPEGLPMAVALTLSNIAKRMKDVDILPKSLAVVETLGFVNVICSDKTGTLTENKMTVASLSIGEKPVALDHQSSGFAFMHRAMVLCNDAYFEESDSPIPERTVKGNATDGALLRFTSTLDVKDFGCNKVFELPFNSRNKYALTVAASDETVLLVKGAPDILLDRCLQMITDDGVVPLDSARRAAVVALQEKWSRNGQRVILLAQRFYTPIAALDTREFEEECMAEAERNLTVIGLVGIVDPPRADIAHTVAEVRRCGSRFFMVTGDFSLTAEAIARDIGIFSQPADRVYEVDKRSSQFEEVKDDRYRFIEAALVVEGKEINNLVESQWDIICQYEEIVFARTTPEQKLRIVTELRERGCVVAVTGDGVNDAPALKAANVGIAMLSGSEVAMEAADLVLMGDFSSIIQGIRLGRLVFQNLQKCISYLLPAGSWSEDWPVILNVFLGCPLPLSSFLMIIICCFTDLACCLTLIFEKEEFDLLSVPPRDPKRSHLIGMRIYAQSYLFIGVMETITAHAMFFYYIWTATGIPPGGMFFAFARYGDGYYGHTGEYLTKVLNTGQCVYFVTLVVLQSANLLSVRNKRETIFKNGPQNNWKIFIGPVISLSIAIFITEVPGIQRLFGTASVPIRHWFIPVPLALGLLMMDEVRKLVVRTWPSGPIARIAW